MNSSTNSADPALAAYHIVTIVHAVFFAFCWVAFPYKVTSVYEGFREYSHPYYIIESDWPIPGQDPFSPGTAAQAYSLPKHLPRHLKQSVLMYGAGKTAAYMMFSMLYTLLNPYLARHADGSGMMNLYGCLIGAPLREHVRELPTYEGLAKNHWIITIMLHDGTVWVIDLTAAQYGFSKTLYTWEEFAPLLMMKYEVIEAVSNRLTDSLRDFYKTESQFYEMAQEVMESVFWAWYNRQSTLAEAAKRENLAELALGVKTAVERAMVIWNNGRDEVVLAPLSVLRRAVSP